MSRKLDNKKTLLKDRYKIKRLKGQDFDTLGLDIAINAPTLNEIEQVEFNKYRSLLAREENDSSKYCLNKMSEPGELKIG